MAIKYKRSSRPKVKEKAVRKVVEASLTAR